MFYYWKFNHSLQSTLKENDVNLSHKKSQGKNLIRNLHQIKIDEKEMTKEESEIINKMSETNGDKEYTLCLKKALREAVEENDRVSESLDLLIKLTICYS